jgi:beta-galactosidase
MLFIDADFERALDNYYAGVRRFKLQQYDLAIENFLTCIDANKATLNHGTTSFGINLDSLEISTDSSRLYDDASVLQIEDRNRIEREQLLYYPTSNAIHWISYIYHITGRDSVARTYSDFFMLIPLDHSDKEIRSAEQYYKKAKIYIDEEKLLNFADPSDNLYTIGKKAHPSVKHSTFGGSRLHYTSKQIPLKRCLEIYTQKLSGNHWKFGLIYYLYGITYFEAQVYDKAEESFDKALSVLELYDCLSSIKKSVYDYKEKIVTISSKFQKAENAYVQGVEKFRLKQFDEAEQLFISCSEENANLIMKKQRPSWGKPYYTHNAPQWLAHIYYIQKNDEGLKFILNKHDDYWGYMYKLSPNDSRQAVEIEINLYDFKQNVKSLTNNHENIQIIDSFYNAQLEKYKSLGLDNSLYIDILVQWAKDCGLANERAAEKRLLETARKYIMSKTGEEYNFMTVLERFETEDNRINKMGNVAIGRYVGQTGYKTKEPQRDDPVIPEEKRKPIHRKKNEKLDLRGEKEIMSSIYHRESVEKDTESDDPRERTGAKFVFEKNITGRYLCIELLNNYNGDEIADIDNIVLYDKFGQRIDTEGWTVIYADSEDNITGNYTAEKAIDISGDSWRTRKSDKFPHQIVIDLGFEHEIIALNFYSGHYKRSMYDKYDIGTVKDFRIYFKNTPFKIKSK